jgi:hypothetical protein
MAAVEVGDRAPEAVVFDPDGREIALSSCWRDRPALLAFLRHYG